MLNRTIRLISAECFLVDHRRPQADDAGNTQRLAYAFSSRSYAGKHLERGSSQITRDGFKTLIKLNRPISGERHLRNPASLSTAYSFRVLITSDAFRSKLQPARHRMVYNILKDELAQAGGIHALQLQTRTPEEEEKRRARVADSSSGTT